MRKKAIANGDRDVVMNLNEVQSDTDDKMIGSDYNDDSEDL